MRKVDTDSCRELLAIYLFEMLCLILFEYLISIITNGYHDAVIYLYRVPIINGFHETIECLLTILLPMVPTGHLHNSTKFKNDSEQ